MPTRPAIGPTVNAAPANQVVLSDSASPVSTSSQSPVFRMKPLTLEASIDADQAISATRGPHAPRIKLRPIDLTPADLQAQARNGSAHAASVHEASPATHSLGLGVRLTCEALENLSLAPTFRASLTDAAREAMDASRATLLRAHARGEAIYGLTTGFGPLVTFAADASGCEQGAGLIAHLGSGFGPAAPDAIVRATMILRAHAIGLGCSGVEPRIAERLLSLLSAGLVPVVPEIGSVGASGDLTPLSFIARALMGQGTVRVYSPSKANTHPHPEKDAAPVDGAALDLPAKPNEDQGHNPREVPAGEALSAAGVQPEPLSGRDALALVNGTSFMTAYAAHALSRGERLITRAEALTGWIYSTLSARGQALHPRLHAARGHEGQSESAASIAREARSLSWIEDPTRPLQEVYSVRCAPQVLGACRDQLRHARLLIETEINGVNDNPVIDIAGDAVLHGGNFQGQQVAFAGDVINQALVQVAVLAERQLDVLLNPDLNGDAPPLLAWTPGATSGLAGAQLTATALVAEMRHAATPVAISSIPTNGRNQDIVSMGTLAARSALAQTERLAGVLAVLALGLAQLNAMRRLERAPGKPAPSPSWMPQFRAIMKDRPLVHEIRELAATLMSHTAPDASELAELKPDRAERRSPAA
ncbi:MAG: aromatic amino acid ammonia-lyase [Planctomycetota bacterium]|nr:aromatic amino acid ammonia-lyase [Planctomycetota bacterium]